MVNDIDVNFKKLDFLDSIDGINSIEALMAEREQLNKKEIKLSYLFDGAQINSRMNTRKRDLKLLVTRKIGILISVITVIFMAVASRCVHYKIGKATNKIIKLYKC